MDREGMYLFPIYYEYKRSRAKAQGKEASDDSHKRRYMRAEFGDISIFGDKS